MIRGPVTLVCLNDGTTVRAGHDRVGMLKLLKKQYAILMKFARKHPKNRKLQDFITDVNHLGLTVADILSEEVEDG